MTPEQFERHWYVSYAWADESDITREEKVDKLCEDAKDKGVSIVRDKTTLSRGDQISEFMNKIGKGDRIFIFLSEKYLHSPYCMFELFEIWRNNRQDKPEFLRHVRFFTVDGAKIGKPDEWLNYTKFWQHERDRLREKIEIVGWRDAGEEVIRAFRNMETFAGKISDVLALFADVVQPRTLDEFLTYGFEDPDEYRPPKNTIEQPITTSNEDNILLDIDNIFTLYADDSTRSAALLTIPLERPGVDRSQVTQAVELAFARGTNFTNATKVVGEASELVLGSLGRRPGNIHAFVIEQADLGDPRSGLFDYWSQVFDHACMLGPRMVGALLLVAPPGVINASKVEITQLFQKLRRI
jgi:TIR domain